MLNNRNHPSASSTVHGVAPRRRLIVATVISAMGSAAFADEGPSFKLTGFGTIAAVHSSDSGSDFVGSLFQPNGAGHTSAWSFNPDSKLGGQVNAVLNNEVAGVVQVVAQHRYDNSYIPQIEWANLTYQLSPELRLRAGRIAAPSFLLSESRFVGYANSAVRPPTEVYGLLPITSNDGADATWRRELAGANNTAQVYVGRSKVHLSGGAASESKLSWGLNDTVEMGALTLRAGYNSLELNLTSPSLTPLLDAIRGMGMAQIADKYKLTNMNLSVTSLAASYDPGDWFLTGEFAKLKGAGFLSDATSWSGSAGYRFGSLTPFAAYASTKGQIKPETGAGPMSAPLTSILYGFTPTQNTASVGMRWDAMKNLALKAQYDSVNIGSSSSGRFMTFAGVTPSKHPKLITLAADFVF